MNLDTVINITNWTMITLGSALIAGNLINAYVEHKEYIEALKLWRANIRNRGVNTIEYN